MKAYTRVIGSDYTFTFWFGASCVGAVTTSTRTAWRSPLGTLHIPSKSTATGANEPPHNSSRFGKAEPQQGRRVKPERLSASACPKRG